MLRFGSSLTQDFHIGNLRVALLSYIVSKQTNEELLIYLKDSNKEILEILNLFNLFNTDYSRVALQSENIKYQTQMAMKLLLDKKAFNCFCSSEAIDLDKQKAKQEGKPYKYNGFCENISDETKFHCNAPFVVRLKKPTKPSKLDSFVILRQDKSPTNNFACAVDDMLYDISTVIQEEENLLNTSEQIHIRESLGYNKQIKYINLPKIIREENLPCVQSLVDEGYLPSAIANYILHLGYDCPHQLFTIEEALEWFDIDKILKTPAKFDITKLNFINKEHMKLLDDMRFSKIIGYADEDFGKLAKIYTQECDTIQQIKTKIERIFSKKETLKGFEQEFATLKACLEKGPFIKDFTELQNYITEKTNLEGEKLLKPLSFALTGTTDNQKLERIYPLIRNYLGEII